MIFRKYNPIKSNSFFLFGARGTGKSTFVNEQFLASTARDQVWRIDLLDDEQEERFSRHPKELETEIGVSEKKFEWIVIDEVQKVPKLLDSVHRLIEKQNQKFILLGSSARKLKKMGANLLAGRAFEQHFFPFSHLELGKQFDLEHSLSWGMLPKIFSYNESAEKKEYLRTYVRKYLKEEILQEQLVRKIEPFREFLPVMSQMNGAQINFSKVARDVGVDPKSIEQYYLILQETFVGFFLPGFHSSQRKAQKVHPKFYFFDLGVKRAIDLTLTEAVVPSTGQYGEFFESFLMNEFYKAIEAQKLDYRMSFFITKNDSEIDLILSRGNSAHFAIEIKSSMKIDEVEVRALERVAQSIEPKQIYYLSQCENSKNIGKVKCRNWTQGFQEILFG